MSAPDRIPDATTFADGEAPGDVNTFTTGKRFSQPFDLRAYTPARVALERTGCSVTTRHVLEFSLAHAQARDAVHAVLDVAAITSALRERGLPSITVHSAAANRSEYLRSPDLGRSLDSTSFTALSMWATGQSSTDLSSPDLSSRPRAAIDAAAGEKPAASTFLMIVIADGLSALAVDRHAIPVIDALLPLLRFRKETNAEDQHSAGDPWRLTPIAIAEQARVALGDQIGAALNADITVTLIGERPGLSSPDSLGAYITWGPRPGRTDAERNCISNIRPPLGGQSGLDYATAAQKIAWYIQEARRLGFSGVALREPDSLGPGIAGNPTLLPTSSA